MPEHLRAYIFILVIAFASFFLAKKMFAKEFSIKNFNSCRNSWLLINTFAFIPGNFWIFSLLTVFHLVNKKIKNTNPLILFVFVLFALPPLRQSIPGFGIINYLFIIDYYMILSLAILLPTFIQLITTRKTQNKSKLTITDFFFTTYCVLLITLQFNNTTFSDALRSCYLIFITSFVPYYCFSRGVKSQIDIKLIFIALFVACMPAAIVGFIEMLKHWLLYTSLEQSLNSISTSRYLGRDGALRALSTFGHSIIFGYCMMLGLGAYLYVKDNIQSSFLKKIALLIIFIGLISSLSRGPWVGAYALFATYLATGQNGIKNVFKLLLFSVLTFFILALLPGGEKLINLIPFIGETEKGSVIYRQILWDTSIQVMQKNLFFGNVNFRDDPDMVKNLLQGEGIVDIVNTYISIAMTYGLVGLFLFCATFISSLWMSFKSMRKIRNVDIQLFKTGRVLIATMLGIMVTIATASNLNVLPYTQLMIIGISQAYIKIVTNRILDKGLMKT